MDALVSGFNVFETKEAGPLILAWAVFLCLISSLPEKEENAVLMEIDHVNYVRQAFEAASLSYFLEILQSNVLKDSDVPIAGYRSVMRTFISAFIASYEISIQAIANHFVFSSGIGIVSLMGLSGVFFATWRVNFHLGLWNLCAYYQPSVKELGPRNVCM
ncbi:unnamed protein product [Ilex paraguariensis]|uniref:Uncharacterized protein n=1 Tax=Ilex paraguariensis TaxID=185542 RepID=A0ABC8SZH1_9AQUA